MTYLLSFKAPKSNQLWEFWYADPAGGLLDEEDLHLAYYDVMLGRTLSTPQGKSFTVPSYIVNNRNNWLPYGRH